VLFQWGDLPRLAALVRLLHTAVTARLAMDNDACDTRWVQQMRLPLVTRTPPPCLGTASALAALAADMEQTQVDKADPARVALLVATARAWFVLLLCFDGRVRRDFLAPGAVLVPLRVVPPLRAIMLPFLAFRPDGVAGEALHFGNDLAALARAAADDPLEAARVQQLTLDFVHYVRDWWWQRAPLPAAHGRPKKKTNTAQ
jgi:hypothetical protein